MPVDVLEIAGNIATEGHQPVLVEVADHTWRAETLEVIRRGVDVEMHREEAAADEIRLHRRAQPQRDIGLTHRKVELVVGEDHLQLDVGVEIEKFGQARRQPFPAKRDVGGNLQFAIRLLAAVRERGAGLLELGDEFARRAEQQFALLGQHEAARVTMEQRDIQLRLER